MGVTPIVPMDHAVQNPFGVDLQQERGSQCWFQPR